MWTGLYSCLSETSDSIFNVERVPSLGGLVLAITIPVCTIFLVVICVCVLKSYVCRRASSRGATPSAYQSAGQGTVTFQTGEKQYSYGEIYKFYYWSVEKQYSYAEIHWTDEKQYTYTVKFHFY